MSKRNVIFSKPEEPSFLKRLKNEIGFEEGPTISTKRETLPSNDDDGNDECLEEQPQVVVLKAGDLNAEEVVAEKKKLDLEKNSRRANLDDRIIFRSTRKDSKNQDNVSVEKVIKSREGLSLRTCKERKKLLSFDADCEDEDLTE